MNLQSRKIMKKEKFVFEKIFDWWPAYYPFHLLKMWRKKKRSGSIFHFNFSISAVVSIKIGLAWGGERDHCHRVSHLICLDTGEEGGGRWEILDWEMWEPIDNLMSALTTWQDPWDISVHHCKCRIWCEQWSPCLVWLGKMWAG